jgi:tetratricopeptide (TPR) repeat protein
MLKAIEFEKDNSDYWFNLALAYEKSNLLQKSIRCYLQTISLDPKDREAWENLAGIYLSQHKYSEALHVLIRAEDENPGDARINYLIAACFYLKKDNKNASVFLLKGLVTDKNAIEVFYKAYPQGREQRNIQKLVNP